MSILELIHGERRMSFNHWRFRVLHWCFNEDATTPKESGLPHFLYSHYCPLFHLTNLIAILLPAILFSKLAFAFGRMVGRAFKAIPWTKPLEGKVANEAAKVRQEKRELLRFLAGDDFEDFEEFWERGGHRFSYLDKEAVEAYYDSVIGRIREAKQKAIDRRERMKQQMIFWTNFSSVFFKWGFNAFYAVLAVFILWLCFWFTMPVVRVIWDLVVFLATFNPIPMFLLIGKMVVVIGVVVFLGYVTTRFRLLNRAGAYVGTFVVEFPPFVLVRQLVCLPFAWFFNGLVSTGEFVAMFYEESCPPIVIITEEEEEIEQAAEGAL